MYFLAASTVLVVYKKLCYLLFWISVAIGHFSSNRPGWSSHTAKCWLSGCLWELKNKGKDQSVIYMSGRSCLRELLITEFKGPITWGGLAQLAGLARFTGISAHLWNTLKINFAIIWKNRGPASWDPSIAMPGSRLPGLKICHVIAIAGPTLSHH